MGDSLKAVLVGCGGISRAWLNAIRDIPELDMLGFVDLNEEAARTRAEEYGWDAADIGTKRKNNAHGLSKKLEKREITLFCVFLF